MENASSEIPAGRAALERRLLRGLCQGAFCLPGDLLGRLAGYRFTVPLHCVIFEELLAHARAGLPLNHVELQSRLTRRGFPEVDLEPFYAPPGEDKEELGRVVARLLSPG